MRRGLRLALFGLAAGCFALGAAGLVSAQQGDAIGALIQSGAPPHAAKPAAHARPAAPAVPQDEPAAPDSALKGTLPPPATASAPDAATQTAAAANASAKPAPPKPAEPMKRPRYAVAVLQAMDKVTAETMRFEAPINQPIRYKSLVFIVRACETTAPDEPVSDAIAHVEIDSAPVAQQGAAAPPARQLFRGWMFANAPGLHLFENPAYDAWLIACKTAAPSA